MGHTALAMEHKWPNATPPLGYERSSDGTLSVLGHEAATVRWIFQRYVKERSMPRVAQLLNDSGGTTKAGHDWTAGTVSDILQNELYAGIYEVGAIEEEVPEYQILSRSRFNAATKVRMRFQRPEAVERPPMDSARKRKQVDDVLNRYVTFQSINNYIGR
jgi:site-specific DNA recombinase